ncbi:MAG: class I SAM-dependent methyltransferase [Desulfobacterales bacterium]|nr:class I SAM-dependent methyltransferase [Desulfobacterales bacterium]
MRENAHSRTAENNAAMRSFESSKPEGRRVCFDPYAKFFIGPRIRLLRKIPFLAPILRRRGARKFPGLFEGVIARTRYFDDYLTRCIDDGIAQLVILGAGFDTRAYRFDALKGKIKVFEVDHPATQVVKKERLNAIFGAPPNHVVYVPVRFDRESLGDKLFESGYEKGLKTLFTWEGVTYYLPAGAVDETLAFVVNNSGEGSSIIFDYFPPSVAGGDSQLKEAKAAREVVRKYNETLQFGIEEGEIESFLTARGFQRVKNVNAAFCDDAYFTGVNGNRRTSRMFSFVYASV